MYHISPETGRPNKCYATKRACPIGGQHFETKDQAREFFEKEQNENVIPDPLAAAMRKTLGSRVGKMEEQIKYKKQKLEELEKEYLDKNVKVTKTFKEISPAKIKEYNQEYAVLEKKLTPDEKESMYDYTGITYSPINQLLNDFEKWKNNNRFPETLDAQIARYKKTIKNLDSFIAKADRKNRIVYRRIDQDLTKEFTGREQWLNKLGYQAGEEIVFKSFSSTTVDPAYISRTIQNEHNTSVVLAMKTTSGAPVDYTASTKERKSTQEGEREILLPRNISFKIKKIERTRFTSSDYEDREILTVFMEELEQKI